MDWPQQGCKQWLCCPAPTTCSLQPQSSRSELLKQGAALIHPGPVSHPNGSSILCCLPLLECREIWFGGASSDRKQVEDLVDLYKIKPHSVGMYAKKKKKVESSGNWGKRLLRAFLFPILPRPTQDTGCSDLATFGPFQPNSKLLKPTRRWQIKRKLHCSHLTSCHSPLRHYIPNHIQIPSSHLSSLRWRYLQAVCPSGTSTPCVPCVPGDRSLIAPWGPTQALTHTEPPLPLRHVSAVKGCPTEEATGSPTHGRAFPSPGSNGAGTPQMLGLDTAHPRLQSGQSAANLFRVQLQHLTSLTVQGKTPPTSTSVISGRSLGSPGWKSHYGSDGNTLRAQHHHILLPIGNGNPKEEHATQRENREGCVRGCLWVSAASISGSRAPSPGWFCGRIQPRAGLWAQSAAA